MTRRVADLVQRKQGITLDLSFGGEPQVGAVTCADLKRSPIALPFPLPNACVHTAVVTHVLEYLPADRWFRWWDDLHRVLKPHGVVHISGPYGGDESQGWLSDPTHITRVVEQSFAWLDPRLPFYALHASLGRRAPKPWFTLGIRRVPGAHGTTSYNVSLQKAVAVAVRKKVA